MEEARGNTNATHRILRTQTPKKVISVGRSDSPIPRSVAKNRPLGTYNYSWAGGTAHVNTDRINAGVCGEESQLYRTAGS